MLVCEEINFELPPKIIVLNPKDGRLVPEVSIGYYYKRNLEKQKSVELFDVYFFTE